MGDVLKTPQMVLSWIVICIMCLAPFSAQAARNVASMSVLTTIEVGGSPDAIVVDCSPGYNDVLYFHYDSGPKVGFIDGDTLTPAPEKISVNGSPQGSWDHWMVYNRYHHLAYFLEGSSGGDGWVGARIAVISGRSEIGGISVNYTFNHDQADPPDEWYAAEGMIIEQPMTEGSNPGRLIIDNNWTGNIDVVDLNGSGTSSARIQRFSYRESVGNSSNDGNSLALETQHETLATDDLSSTDILYVSDKDYLPGVIRRIRIAHPLQDLNAVALPDLDLSGTWPFYNGREGLGMAGPRDTLYVSSNVSSNWIGYIGEVDTANNQVKQVIELDDVEWDEGFVCVDWSDTKKVFVLAESGYNLFLFFIYDGTVVDKIFLTDEESFYYKKGCIAFDPYYQRVYVAEPNIDSIIVIQLDYTAPTPTPYDYKTPTPGPTSIFTTPTPPPSGRRADVDFDGDGTSDIGVFRTASGMWAIRGVTRAYFGGADDLIVPGDYNGDGTSDIGIFRTASGLWAIQGVTRAYFGGTADLPVPGDYDGDGTADVGIYRTTSGLWAVKGVTRIYFGGSTDEPVPGYYNGDAAKDIGIFRRGSGLWAVKGITRAYFGSSSDDAMPGDYDGDGAWDIGIFRPTSGLWAIQGVTRAYFGSAIDDALTADYAGNGIDDIGIFRPSSGLWAIKGVTRSYFGGAGDVPITR